MLRDDFKELRPANVTKALAKTQEFPAVRPIGTMVIRKRTAGAVLRELHRLQRRGYVHSASELAQYHERAGGGFGVKIALLRPLPEPMPGWAKGCALVGGVMMACSGVGIIALNAFAGLMHAAASLPWTTIIGGAIAVAVVLAFTRPGRSMCRVVVEHWH